MTYNLDKYYQLADRNYYRQVWKVVGLTIESVGPNAKLNDLCRIIIDKNRNISIMAEVVGFRDKRLLLMPYESVEGLGVGCIVENTGHPLSVCVGDEMLGHTLDGMGRPTDIEELSLREEYPVDAPPPDPMDRVIISEVLPLGVKAVDGLITVGKGQRIGIFAGSGVGKSTLLGMFARNTKADINVIALIGERGREDCHCHCGIFQGSGQGRTADDGFTDTFFHGAAGNRPGFRRTAGHQRISAQCVL